jgi:hypothetical protein
MGNMEKTSQISPTEAIKSGLTSGGSVLHFLLYSSQFPAIQTEEAEFNCSDLFSVKYFVTNQDVTQFPYRLNFQLTP